LASKILAGIFAEIDKLILKFTWKGNRHKIVKVTSKAKLEKSHFPISKLSAELQDSELGIDRWKSCMDSRA
jgi:hypothetical protein